MTDDVTRQGRTGDRAVRPRDAADSTSATARSRDAARRERQRLNADLGRAASSASAWRSALIRLATIVIGLVMPIGMFGFLAAVGLAIGVAALLAFTPAVGARLRAGAVGRPAQRRDGRTLRFLSLPRAPRAARARAGRDRRDQRGPAVAQARRWSAWRRSIPTRRTRGG